MGRTGLFGTESFRVKEKGFRLHDSGWKRKSPFPASSSFTRELGSYTQAFFSLGGLMVTGVYYVAATYGDCLPAIRGDHEGWRYTMLSGMIPTIPLILIRPFLPESPIWQEKRSMDKLKRPSLTELFRPALRKTTVLTTLLMALPQYSRLVLK